MSELSAPDHWRELAFISDLHLQASDTKTFALWRHWLERTEVNALFILGDLFEVWIGDDAAQAGSFEAECQALLRELSRRCAVYLIHGNRDFLIGADCAAACGATLLDDPSVLIFNQQRWLLSHGDALCLGDTQYQQFRLQVRSRAWQQDFLARPLAEREHMARAMRQASMQRRQSLQPVTGHIQPTQSTKLSPAMDVDHLAARHWLHVARSHTLIHGHTHCPAQHDLGHGMQRIVLSDWDGNASPPRAQVLQLTATGLQRIDLTA